MRTTVKVLVALLAVILSACSSKDERPAVSPPPVRAVGTGSINADILSNEAANLAYWLSFGQEDRVLVHVSALDGLSPASDDALKALKKETFMKAAMAPRPSNMVYAAHALGIVKEVYWVVPKFTSITVKDFQDYKSFLKETYPGREKDIDRLKLDGAVIEGAIYGIPIKILSLQDLPNIDAPVLLNIDSSFFSALYQDEKKTRLLSLVSGFVKNVKEKGISSDIVTLSYSTEPSLAALRLRCVSDYLRQILKDPEMLAKDPPALWAERASAWKAESRSFKEASAIYKSILRESPNDNPTRFDLANAYFSLGDYAACLAELDRVSLADPGYRVAYRIYADNLSKTKDRDKAGLFLAYAESGEKRR